MQFASFYSFSHCILPKAEQKNVIFDKFGGSCTDRKLNSVLEVGCYDGYILYHLKKKGYSVTGCDPSKGAEIGEAHGVPILRRFFDATEFFKDDDFSVLEKYYIMGAYQAIVDSELQSCAN